MREVIEKIVIAGGVIGLVVGFMLLAFSAAGCNPEPEEVSGDDGPGFYCEDVEVVSQQAFIVQGTPAENPFFTVRVVEDLGNNQQNLCTGTLIGDGVILTAAHCGFPDTVEFVGQASFPVLSVIHHPEYNETLLYADLSLVFFDNGYGGVTVSGAIPIGVPTLGSPALIQGYGATNDNEPVSNVLLEAVVYTAFYLDGKVYTEFSIPEKPDTCFGDSGGPMYQADAEGVLRLVGVTSHGVPNAPSDCGHGGAYTMPAAGINWINRYVETGLRCYEN